MPSMVTMSAPSACIASMLQDFTARPFMWIVQAPHCAVSQPTCVPVRRRLSRMKLTSSVRSSTSALAGLPLTVRETLTVMIRLLWRRLNFFLDGVLTNSSAKKAPRQIFLSWELTFQGSGEILDHARAAINKGLNPPALDPSLSGVYAIAYNGLLAFSNIPAASLETRISRGQRRSRSSTQRP